MFKNVIVRTPAKSISDGITSSSELGKPNYENALKQHKNYIQALKKCGVQVEVLEARDELPDSCFVEDIAVCTKKFAIVTNPSAKSRNSEIEGIKDILAKYYKNIEEIKAPGTLEGGDVMMVDEHFYIGLSDRTNLQGANQLIEALRKYGMSGSVVDMKEMLHLKTGLSYLEENALLITGEFTKMSEFNEFEKIEVSDDEAYSANCIRVNDYVIVPKNFPKTKKLIEDKGFKTLEVDTSEFMKIDGGLSCLSLRF